MILLLLATALAQNPGPREERRFGGWVVTCDKVRRCEARAVLPASAKRVARSPAAMLVRDPGPRGSVSVEIMIDARAGRIVDVLIDRRLVATAPLRDGKVRIQGAAAEGLARAMAASHVLTLRYGRRTLATIPLAGASATLRHIDAQQGRAGGVTALVARGPKPAAMVPLR